MTRLVVPSSETTSRIERIDHLKVEWIIPDKPAGTILYLHGGAYTLGSIKTHRSLASMLANHTQMQVLLPEYRLAPEAPFPAGLEDAAAAYRWLLKNGISADELIIAGDSAGGGLALATLLQLRDTDRRLPAGAVLLSPWTDLTMSGKSARSKAHLDFILNCKHLTRMAQLYAGGQDLHHPLISPVFADLSDLPPILIQVGTDEILLDDATRLAGRAEKDGCEITLEIFDGMFHAFHMFPFIRETRQAFQSIAIFSHKITRPD